MYFDQIVQRWTSQSLRLLPPHDGADVIAALTATGKPFANDLVELYRTTGGMDGDMDNLYFSLWPLHQVRFDNMHSPDPDLTVGDVLLDCFRFTLNVESDAASSVYGGYDRRKVADSLEDFWHIYLTDPHKLDLV